MQQPNTSINCGPFMDTMTRQTSVSPTFEGWLRLTNGEDSGGTAQNMPPNYANEWRNPPVIAGG